MLTLGLGLLPGCPGDTPVDTDNGSSSSGEADDTTTDDPPNPTTGPETTDPDTTITPTSETTIEPTTVTETDPTLATDPTSATETDPTSETDPTVATDTDTGPDTDTDTDTTTGTPTTLCERLGGPADDGVGKLVGTFLGVVLTDQRINGYFLNDDVDGAALGQLVTEQIGEAVGCEGVVYTGQDMKTAHMGMGISTADFNDFAEDFTAAFNTHKADHPDLTDDDFNTILGALAGMAPDIVEDADSNATVYQRVGRKPAIVGLIGKPDAMDSFVGIVAANPAINSFFANSDFDRLNTCLVRQVADIDGPTKYGQEVDPPAPDVDPGVALANKCRDMVTSHQDLKDADDEPILIEDFLALVTDLVTAMTNAGVADGDQQAILGVLGPLCDQIVVPIDDKNACPGNSGNATVEAANLGALVEDNAYNGTLDTMTCTTLTVTDDGLNFVDGVELKFGADSTWVGDMTIKVVSPDAKILTVVSRPKTGADFPDNGTDCCGSSSNLAAGFPLVFKNAAAADAKLMGSSLGDDEVVCQDDNVCEYKPNPATGPGMNFDDFRGDPAVGDWKVCVGDSGSGDDITIDYVGLTFSKVKFDPVP